jgi:DNA ligase-associated metallophosphoesterase
MLFTIYRCHQYRIYLRCPMQPLISHTILNNHFLLSSQRCIFWEEKKILIVSDLHLGKSGHFRKEGIAVPQAILKEDLHCFVTLIQTFKPVKIVIIGDMFHSHANKELDFFLKWRNDFSYLPMQLIKGNHDILKSTWYSEAAIEMINDQLVIDNFIFAHDISSSELMDGHYTFSGHIHPAISIRGLGRQSLQFACFYFGKEYAVLPAFSKFTGTCTIRQKHGEDVFAIIPADHKNGERGGMIKVKHAYEKL